MSELRDKLNIVKEVNEIAEIAINSFGLSYDKTGHNNLHDPLLRWSDFILRYIPPAKRIILKSDRFPVKISNDAKVGLRRIEKLLTSGGNVNAYQSKTLTLLNDTSGKKDRKRTDGLWADWDFHHIHLPLHAADPAKKYSDRSDWILFLKVYANAVLFIDIKHHDRNVEPDLFSQQDLVKTFVRNWPEEADRSQLRGVLGTIREEPLTDADIGRLRNSGINTPFEMNGKVYMSFGMGMTTAVTAARVSFYRDKIYHFAREIEDKLVDEKGQFMLDLKRLSVSVQEYQIMMFEDGGLGIHEKSTNKAWKFPRENIYEPQDLFCLFNNYLMPIWAGPTVISYWIKNQ